MKYKQHTNYQPQKLNLSENRIQSIDVNALRTVGMTAIKVFISYRILLYV